MTATLQTFVGARLALDKDRQDVPADMTAEDDALVNLLSGAGITDPQGRAHFVSALREHLLSTQSRPSTAKAEEATGSPSDTGSGSDNAAYIIGPDSTDAEIEDAATFGRPSQKKQPPLHGHTHHGISSHGHRAFLVDEDTSSGNESKQR